MKQLLQSVAVFCGLLVLVVTSVINTCQLNNLEEQVIATGRLGIDRITGNLEFMNRENAALVDYDLVPVRDRQEIYTQVDQLWAEPEVDHAAEWLRSLAGDRDLRARIGAAAARQVAAFFNPDTYRVAIGGSGLGIGAPAAKARPGEAA